MPKYLDETGLAHLWSTIEDIAVDSAYYDEITITTGRANNTDYYLAFVPKYDNGGSLIPLSVGYSATENPLEYAGSHGTTLTINGNGTIKTTNNSYETGITIGDGVVLNDNSFYGRSSELVSPLVYEKYIGFKADRSIVEYGMSTNITSAQMLSDGCVNVVNCYFKMVSGGTMIDLDTINPSVEWNGTTATSSTRTIVMAMGVKSNGDLYFLTCDGRTAINKGMGYADIATMLTDLSCTDVYILDGGGSACMVDRGAKINRSVDDNQTTVRNIHYSINFTKQSRNADMQRSYDKVGEEKQRTIAQLIPYINAAYQVFSPGTELANGTDLNTLGYGKYFVKNATAAASMVNSPLSGRGYTLLCFQVATQDDTMLQISIANTPLQYQYRYIYQSGSVFEPWRSLPAIANYDFSISKNASYDVPYVYLSPFWLIVWSSGTSIHGLDFVYYANSNLSVVEIVPTNGTATQKPVYTIDTTNKTLNISNANTSSTLRGIAIPAV